MGPVTVDLCPVKWARASGVAGKHRHRILGIRRTRRDTGGSGNPMK